jgi:hypothetical protein
MNVTEIIYKSELELEEVIFVIEEYIFELKKVRVHIGLRSTPQYRDLLEFQLLFNAFQTARDYFITKHNGNDKN